MTRKRDSVIGQVFGYVVTETPDGRRSGPCTFRFYKTHEELKRAMAKKMTPPAPAKKASPNPAKAASKANVKTTFGVPKKAKK